MWLLPSIAAVGLLLRFALVRSPAEPAWGAAQAVSLGGAAATTEAILSAQGPSCLACVQKNGCLDPGEQGNTCERTDRRPHRFAGRRGSADSCAAVLGSTEPAEPDVCLRALHRIFSSGCASARWLTPCLCGSTDPAACLGGTAPPAGPLAGIYACDFDSPRSADIQANFLVQTFGAGTANAIVLCAAQSECPCFGD